MAVADPVREAAPTKEGLPRSSWGYTPSNDPSTWKLKLYDAAGKPDPDTLPGAAAALSEGGFRGHKADIPAAALPAVKAKVRSAYRKWKGRDAEYPDSVKESEVREVADPSTPGLVIREATILLDRGSVCATVIFAPNGDAYVVPSYDGAFDAARKPLEPYDKSRYETLEDVWDAQDAASILSRLYGMKGDEAEEPEQVALIDKAIAAVTAFMKAEGDEIGAPAATAEASVEAFLSEAGKRNSSGDLKRIQTIHDHTHELGAVHQAGSSYAGMAEALEPTGDPQEIRFAESSGAAIPVTLAEAAPVFDMANKTVTITPIRPGWGNARDNYYYPAQTLKEATEGGLFDHIKMFRNHPRRSDEKDLPERSVSDWFATTQEATWDPVRAIPRVPIKVHDSDVLERFAEAPEQIAFSVLGGGTARPGKVSGKDGRIVEAFQKVRSVDWVTEAGAGGALDFAESAAEEFDMELDKLTAEQLREGAPALYAQLTGIKEHEAATATAEPEKATEPEKAAEPTKAEATAATATATTEPEKAAAPEAPATPEAPAATAEPVAEASPTRAEFDELRKQIARPAMREAAEKAIVEEFRASTLPAKAKEVIAEGFRESGWGAGYVYADEPAFRQGVQGELARAARMLGAAPKASAVKGMGPTATEGSTPATVVESRISERWGEEVMPRRHQLVFAPGELTPESPATPVAEDTVQGRMAAKLG